MNVDYVGNGKVVLIAGGDKVYTDIAARFVGSERSLDDIIASPYDKEIVKNILNSGHYAATEFDNFIFGVEGYSRVTEIQLVRKRIAEYLIKTGRKEKHGKRSFDMIIPESIADFKAMINISTDHIMSPNWRNKIINQFPDLKNDPLMMEFDILDLMRFTEDWYNQGIDAGYKEEDLRYGKQQATEFKAIFSMNAHGLMDWFKVRLCMNAQEEIRDLATKTYKICMDVAPDLFAKAGPNCKFFGYCPEGEYQNPRCKGKIHTKEEVFNIVAEHDRQEKDIVTSIVG